jgi:hypothetical protein
MVNEPTLIHFKEQSVSTPNKFFAKKKIRKRSAPGESSYHEDKTRFNGFLLRAKAVETAIRWTVPSSPG